MTLEQHFTPEQVAQSLGVSLESIYRLCMSGEIRSYRPRSLARRLIPQSAVKEFLNGEGAETTLAQVHER